MTLKKRLIIHADDAGLAWSENKATQDGILHGSISSTSLMVPCPWFYEMAQFCLDYPDTDYGIHLTLTGEWKSFPIRCISNPDKIPSLVDNHGFFFKKRTQIRDYAKLDEVRRELKNQIDYALFMGLKPSHLDSHMYTLGLRQDLLDLYIELGKEYKLPILLSKKLIACSGENPTKFNLPEELCLENVFMASINELENEGLHTYYDHILESLPEGLSIILIHPAKSSSEMDQITIDHPNFGAQWRSEDANYFSSLACKQKLNENNIELVNFKNPDVINLLGA